MRLLRLNDLLLFSSAGDAPPLSGGLHLLQPFLFGGHGFICRSGETNSLGKDKTIIGSIAPVIDGWLLSSDSVLIYL
jgi:hypothetical protein